MLQAGAPATHLSCKAPVRHLHVCPCQHIDIGSGAFLIAGPALSAGGKARIAFVPDTPEVSSLVRRLAMAVSCPTEAYKRICSAASITTFACLFGVQQAPAQCQASSSWCVLAWAWLSSAGEAARKAVFRAALLLQ